MVIVGPSVTFVAAPVEARLPSQLLQDRSDSEGRGNNGTDVSASNGPGI